MFQINFFNVTLHFDVGGENMRGGTGKLKLTVMFGLKLIYIV